MEDEIKALREEIAALRRDVARLEGLVGAHRAIPLPAQPSPWTQPVIPAAPYAPTTWYSTCKSGLDGAGTYAINSDGSIERVHD